MAEPSSSGQAYAFGHDSAAIQRLQKQGELLNPFTKRLFEDAGLTSGMHVLDVGCGAGDVSLIAGELVGDEGSVVGVDANPAALEVARTRAQTARFRQVSFLAGDIHELAQALDRTFDAIVGRLILQHVSEPSALLRLLAQRLRPGGLMAFQEYDLTGSSTVPPSALWSRVSGWSTQAIQRAGLELRMGMKLYSTYLAAGLPAPQLRYEAAIGAGPDFAGYDNLADTIRVLQPLILRYELASAEEIDIETLADRLREEVSSQGAVIRMNGLISAWTRTPPP